MKELSRRQQEVFDFIKMYCKENGYSPSLADIAKGLNLHDSTVATYVQLLKEKGAVQSDYRVARSLRVVS